MIKGIPISVETGIVGLVVAVIGSVVSMFLSGQPLTWPVIVSAIVAAALNYFTSSQRAGRNPGIPSNPEPPSTGGQSW